MRSESVLSIVLAVLLSALMWVDANGDLAQLTALLHALRMNVATSKSNADSLRLQHLDLHGIQLPRASGSAI
eukprot:5907225-Amphidinium_carterae.1